MNKTKTNFENSFVICFFFFSQTMVRTNSCHERRLENSSSSGNLHKFSKFLAQKDKKDSVSPTRNRSLSLDWGDARSVKAIKSCFGDSPMDVLTGLSASPSAPDYLNNKTFDQRIMKDLRESNSHKKKSLSLDIPEGQASKRKSDKRGLLDTFGLFDAVEQQDLDLVKFIVDSSTVDINSLNSENLSVLDIAVMTNNIPIAKLLLSKGAKESPIFQRQDCRIQKLEALVTEAEKKVVDLTATVLNGTSGNANISPGQLKENEKLLSHWEFRHRLLKRMKAGYDHAKPPEPPTNVRLQVSSSSSLLVTFDEPQSHNGAVVTKYKVEWSLSSSFVTTSGEAFIEHLLHLKYEIKNLVKGCHYFVRVFAWNVKGFGLSSISDPPSATPSNWREVDGIPSRLEGKLASLYTLYQQMKRLRSRDSSEMKELLNKGTESPRQKKRISIKNLFISTPKFQKAIKRGVYLVCLFYNEDKILVTSEEQLPMIEVDESFSAPSINNDLYWLLKISCIWEEVKVLKQDMERTSSAGSTFRCKLLQAIISLQNCLGITDLGQIFHRPLRDQNNSIIFTVINNVRDPKLITFSSSKWVTFGKLARRQSLSSADSTDAHTLLLSCVPEMILYNQVSLEPLPRGLYLGYVKLQASVDVLKVMVPNKSPNCVPHIKIRDLPNVSREEWEWLLKADTGLDVDYMTNTQRNFQNLLMDATKKLFTYLDLPESTTANHRIYDLEVLELSPSVAMILILPSLEDICLVPGHQDTFTKKPEFCFLPVQIFESIHMHAYLPEFVSLYARLSARVEMDGVLAQQEHREAFSSEELQKAKEQVQQTANLQQTLDRIWKCARWIRDITTYARTREKKSGILLSHLFSTGVQGSHVSTLNEVTVKATKLHLHFSSSSSTKSSSRSVGKDQKRIAKFYDPNEETPHSTESISIGEEESYTPIQYALSAPPTPVSQANCPHLTPSSSFSSTSSLAESSLDSGQDLSYAIIKVHALYDTGLNRNVNIKLHITEQTTSRDIVNLVVRHLNSIVQTKGKGVLAYSEDVLSDFCLVLKYQGHEKVLKEDYKLLQLKSQLQRAKICVMMIESLFSEDELGQATIV
ncbi:ankyrin repeat and fibronectin type-III domain-containing protein 1 [Biomphalaria glabrata]|nr:ankyrin repeat and fibronectin type-III domain-containing protein 1 [Biomphalaria glabrata]